MPQPKIGLMLYSYHWTAETGIVTDEFVRQYYLLIWEETSTALFGRKLTAWSCGKIDRSPYGKFERTIEQLIVV